jgi:hypothetical protein
MLSQTFPPQAPLSIATTVYSWYASTTTAFYMDANLMKGLHSHANLRTMVGPPVISLSD